jgi:hypothetical protein
MRCDNLTNACKCFTKIRLSARALRLELDDHVMITSSTTLLSFNAPGIHTMKSVHKNIHKTACLLLLLLDILSGSLAFAPNIQSCKLPRPSADSSSYHQLRRRHTARFVFERMSEDCIASLVTAQELASRFEAESVGTDCLLAGCLDHPTPSLRRTLKQYKLSYRSYTQGMQELYNKNKNEINNSQQLSEGFLMGFKLRKQKEDRPFSKPSKVVLQRAGTLARDSTTIETHHLFLSLLEYKGGDDKASASSHKNPESDAWAVVQHLLGDSDNDEQGPSARDMTQSLLQNIQDNPHNDQRELVTGASSSSKTPTLAECGVDLTEQARDGLLDPVHGREAEIRACMRTLLRRRKNNAVLLGDPGVGSK